MKKTFYFLTLIPLTAGITALSVFRSRPALDAHQFVSGLPALKPDLRLTVATVDLVKTSSGQSRKVAWGLDWGTTKAALSAPCRVHYAIDLSGPEPVEFLFGKDYRTLIATFPDPEARAVEVFSARKQSVVEPGWGRLEIFSGQNLLDLLDRGLYDAVRADASSASALAQAKQSARTELQRLAADYAARVRGEPVNVIIRFRSDEPGPILQASRSRSATFPF